MISRIVNFCNTRLEMTGGLHNIAALAIIIYNSFFYSFFIRDFFSYIALLYCMGSILCIILLTMEAWPESTKKYHGTFWVFSLFFALPLPYFFELYSYEIVPEFILRLALSLFILGILVDWLVFFVMVMSAWLVAALTTSYFGSKVNFIYGSDIFEITILLLMMMIITTFLMKKRQELIAKRLNVAKSVAGILSHEIRTPLANIHMQLQLLQESLKLKEYNKVQGIFSKISQVESQISNFIDHSLINIQSDKEMNLEMLDAFSEVQEILDTYRSDNEFYFDINFDIENNFGFLGDKVLFKHVILNLLKNSIYYVSSCKYPKITISFESLYDMNVIIFEDNGEGIEDHIIDKMFDSFFTTKSTGAGLGLFFCQESYGEIRW